MAGCEELEAMNLKKETRKMTSQEKTKELLKKLAQGIKEIKTSEEFKKVLNCMGQFHSYSLGNTILIYLQYPRATKVAGFQTWKKLNRYVRKGEKGISILAPARYKKNEKELEPESNEEKEVEKEIAYFFPVCVFDISQTEGQKLPKLNYKAIENTHSETLEKLLSLAEKNNIKVEFESLEDCEGLSSNGKIKVEQNKNNTEKSLILIHELAHELLHWNPETRPNLTREQKELEAEATAYVVANALQIPETNSERYLALYHKSYDLEESLESIHETSQKILTEILTIERS